MQVTVYVPAALRQFAAGERRVQVDVEEPTLSAVFEHLHSACPGVAERALDERGFVRQHINIFVDGELIRIHGLGLQTPVEPGSEVWILPAVSGGCGGF
jgi:molybdopterin synthase sulfur carrier subunit